MNQDDLETSQEPVASNLPLPGQLIRQTREQRGLSVPDLSEKTRLTENVINAVERDDYAAMGEPVYARGYYRKCGEALGLNDERLVEAYEQHSGTGSPVPRIEQRPSIAYREGPGKLAWGGAVGLMLLVFLVCGLWMWGDEAPQVAAAPTPQQVAEVSPTPRTVRAAPTSAAQPQASPGADSGQDFPATQNQTAARSTAAPFATPPTITKQAAAQQQTTTAVTAEAQPTTPPATAQQQDADQLVRLRVDIKGGEAWVNVSDIAGEKLLYKLLQDGSTREIQGRPPFRISLGRADHVRMQINGENVDFSPQIGPGLTAKFLLDARGRLSETRSAEAG